MSARKPKKGYGPGGEYYRRRITRPDGKTEDVYGRTQKELAEKVTLRLNALEAEKKGAAPYVFEYAAAFYARRAPHLSEKRRRVYEQQINKVICPVIGGKLLAEVTPDDLADVLATRAHLSRRTQTDTVQILKQMFAAAEDSELIRRDPARRLKPGGRPAAKKEALTETQQEQLLAAVQGLKVEPFVMLALYTGMRRGEICGLRWGCVHLDDVAPYIEVRRACRWPNNGRGMISDEVKTPAALRRIPIPPVLVDYLAALRAQLAETDGQRLASRCVYCGADGGPVTFNTFRRRWETIKTRSTASGRALGEKIPKHRAVVTLDFMPTPHTLRHTYITRLVLSGMDLKRVQYLAGHADPKITLQIYTSLQNANPEDVAEEVWAAFDAGDDA